MTREPPRGYRFLFIIPKHLPAVVVLCHNQKEASLSLSPLHWASAGPEGTSTARSKVDQPQGRPFPSPPVLPAHDGRGLLGTMRTKMNSYCNVMRTCRSCNCYYCQTQIEKHNLCDTNYQLSLCGKTCPHCRSLSGDTQCN